MAIRDESLDTLLRMAGEAERFELEASFEELGHDSGQTPPGLVRQLPTRRSDARVFQRLIAGAAGLAACLGLAFVAARGFAPSTPAGPQSGRQLAQAGAADTTGLDDIITAMIAKFRDPYEIRPVSGQAADSAADRSMLLAVFKDGDAPCGCVLWKPANFGGRPLTEVSRAELVAAAYKAGQHDRCAAGGSLTFVMGLEGPGEALPAGHAAAEALASCVAQSQPSCGSDSACYASDALRCLPEGVDVVAEALPR
ncbi:MAG: hypothetical protein GC200_07100 [Tepidisphaera sp.]|nr:hypothetical protein [Tepidisphaera sp.]